MEIKTGNQTEPNPIWRPLTSHNIAFHSDSSKKRAGVVCVGAPRSPRHCQRRASRPHVSRAFIDRRTGDTLR